MALRVRIGTYYSTTSLLHALDPRVKLIAAVLYMVSCFFVTNVQGLLLAAAGIVAAITASKVPPLHLFNQVKPALFFLSFTSLFNLFFVRTGEVFFALGPVSLYVGGLWAAILYTSRFFFLLLAGTLLTLTTTPTALCDAFERLCAPLARLGAPISEVALILSIALRFVPTLISEAEDIIAAQTARGADLEGKSAFAYARACTPLIVPLFAGALRHAEHLGCAMDARCYMGGTGRTHYHELVLNTRRDGGFVLCMLIYLAGIAALYTLG